MKVNDPAFKHIEAEIINYHENLEEIKKLTEPDFVGLQRILLIKRVNHLEQVTGYANQVYERGNDVHKMIMDMYYSGGSNTWNEIAEQLNVSKKEILKHRDEIIFTIANKLGWT